MTEEVLYHRDGRIARITLNRPETYNALSETMPENIQRAVDRANDERARVIILEGAEGNFCSGHDLTIYAEDPAYEPEMPWDPLADYEAFAPRHEALLSVWRSHIPVIAKVAGVAVGGGCRLASCADIVVIADDARIGYTPARAYGCTGTAMMVYALGLQAAKRMLLTGDLIDGKEAERIGLAYRSVPEPELEPTVRELAERMAKIPKNQLMMHKLLINQAYENMGLSTSQLLGTLFDGIARHSPEGLKFRERASEVGFRQAVEERDTGEMFP